MCAHLCICLCACLFYVCACSQRGTGCVGCYLLLQRVTANHQPWQTLGERGGKREERGRDDKCKRREKEEMAPGERIGIWIPLSNHRVFRILSSQSLYGFGPELDNRVASHLAHWQLIILLKQIDLWTLIGNRRKHGHHFWINVLVCSPF